MRSQKPVAVVTASTAGIGLACAESLAAAGMHVVVSSRGQENVEQAVTRLNSLHGPDAASGLPCHVGRKTDREALVQHVRERGGQLQALVLNAAASTAWGSIFDTTEEQWDKMFDVNVKGAFMLVKEFNEMLQRGSAVVFVTSIAAYNALPGLGAYSITKTALLGLCKVLSAEMGKRGVRVNAVAPGLIQTKFSERLWKREDGSVGKSAGKSSGMSSKFFHVPLRRIGVAGDIGGVVAFLVSKEAAYITGETIVVAGGAMSKL